MRSRAHDGADSGRFVAMPGRRGNRGGVGAILRNTCNVWSRAPGNGVTACGGADSRPSCSAAARPSAASSADDGALPRDEAPAVGQQRCGVLAQHRERGDRAGRHEVVPPESVRPALGAVVDHRDVGEPDLLGSPQEIAAMTRGGLDEEDLRVRAGRPRARTPATRRRRRCPRCAGRLVPPATRAPRGSPPRGRRRRCAGLGGRSRPWDQSPAGRVDDRAPRAREPPSGGTRQVRRGAPRRASGAPARPVVSRTALRESPKRARGRCFT